MLRFVFNGAAWLVFALTLTGCGLAQTVSEGTASTASAVFYKQVKTLHLDFTGRASLNTHAADMNALSVATLVRIYQLRDSQALERAPYEALVAGGAMAVGGDVLDERMVVIKPGGAAQLSVPLDSEAQVVAVVALFRHPDVQTNSWRLIMRRDELHPDRARVVELADNRLTLQTLAKD